MLSAQLPLDWVQVNVIQMKVIVIEVADSMICKSALPDFCIRSKVLLRAIGEAAFNHLNGTFESDCRGDQKMEMIRHKNKFVKEIRVISVGEQILEEQPRPRFCSEQGAAFPRLRGDEIGLRVVGCVLARGFQDLPSAVKAAVSIWPLRHG